MTKEKYLLKLGQHVSKLREKAGLNQSQLGSLCEKDRQSIQRLEKGRINPSAYYLLQIAQALDIPAKELLDFY